MMQDEEKVPAVSHRRLDLQCSASHPNRVTLGLDSRCCEVMMRNPYAYYKINSIYNKR